MRVVPTTILTASLRSALLAAVLAASAGFASAAAPQLELQKGDRIVLVGNTFAERMIDFGYFETIASLARRELDLTFRNLGWSADEVTRIRQPMFKTGWHEGQGEWYIGEAMLQPRPLAFGDMHTHLKLQKADVVIACFGMNESFYGEAGLTAFAEDLRRFVRDVQSNKYHDDAPARLVLVGPIPHEKLPAPLPNPQRHNQDLKLYNDTMREVAAEAAVPFVDLYSPLIERMTSPGERPLTINGIHLTAYGDWIVSQILAAQLGIASPGARITIDLRKNGLVSPAVRRLAALDKGVEFAVEGVRLIVPPRPAPEPGTKTASRETGADSDTQADLMPQLAVEGLAPGRYELQIDGQAVLTAPESDWSRGVRVSAPPQSKAEEIRALAIDKCKQFFYRWRAVNGEYIYGRRQRPFGVVSFPPEMDLLDKMVADRETQIHEIAAQPDVDTFRLVRVGD
jgi:hypothetical protein